MAIAFDNAGSVGDVSATGVQSWTHTVNSNTNGMVLAFFSLIDNTGTAIINPSPTYNGTAMTSIISGSNTVFDYHVDLWCYPNPPTGLGTIAGTWSNAGAFTKNAVSLSYTGVSGIVGSARNIGTGNFGSINLAISGNDWLAGGLLFDGRPGTMNTGNNRGTISVNTNGEVIGADNTTGILVGTTSLTKRWLILAADLGAAAGGVVAPVSFRSLLGVGI